MSPAHVLEPTYDSIKLCLMEGRWPMGLRLEAAKLADSFGVSITPVRDSLNRLYGEHMVDFVAGDGFRVPHFDEARLRDLLGLNRTLIAAALDRKISLTSSGGDGTSDIADQTADLFLTIARRSSNDALISSVRSISDQLHFARNLETSVFEQVEEELSELRNALRGGSTARTLLKGLVSRYHERRLAQVPELIRAMTLAI